MGNNGNNGSDSRAMVPANQRVQVAQLQPQTVAFIETIGQRSPDIAQRVMELVLSRPANAPLSPARALQAALRERRTGEVEGRDFYADEKMGVVTSYRGEQREADNAAPYTQTRPLTQQENEDHEIKAGDTAVAVEVYSPVLRDRALRVGAPYRPIIGIGIVRNEEKFKTRYFDEGSRRYVTLPREKWEPIDPPTGRSWRWKAEQRALKDGLRHLPGAAATVQEVLDMAEEEGLDVDIPEGARLSMDQAETVLERARIQKQAAEQPHQRVDCDSRPAGFEGYDDVGEGLHHTEPTIEAEYHVEAPQDAVPDEPGDLFPQDDPGDAPITRDQQRALFAAGGKTFGKTDDFRAWLANEYHIGSTNDMTVRQFQDAMNRMDVMRRDMQGN